MDLPPSDAAGHQSMVKATALPSIEVRGLASVNGVAAARLVEDEEDLRECHEADRFRMG